MTAPATTKPDPRVTVISAEYHQGPVHIRFYPWGVGVLCPLGHSVTSRDFGNPRSWEGWAGSDLQARISWHQHAMHRPHPDTDRHVWVVRCHGALPQPATA